MASRNADSLEEGARAIKQATDREVARPADDVERDLGSLDILVNSSACPRTKPFTELFDEDRLAALDTKFLAQVRSSREIFPRMKSRGGGRIVNIVGSNGKFPQRYDMTVGVLNAALLNLTKALAEEGAPHNVLVNAINSRLTRTDRIAYLAKLMMEELGISFDKAVWELVASHQIKRLGDPSEIASMIVFMVSARGSFITGSLIDVDGGATPSL
ncbi:MAG: hypothetical protein CL569_16795 [Alphaproteobacteria bacterium]|nr:hypothetical protein [Alphaproteobacteria bacterium]